MARFSKSVLYRLPIRIGAALALSLVAPAFAQDPPPAGASKQQTATPDNSSERKEMGPEYLVVTGGSVRRGSANAQEAEDLSLPELPTATDKQAQ